jgi:electron transport complex protein RnfC
MSETRKIWPIHGGVHPAENKQQSLREPITLAALPNEVILPLSQHIGAAAEPVVAVGDRVLTGQKVAKAHGFVSVPVHASISGTVTAIEKRPIPHASGLPAPCIVIESDGKDEWAPRKPVVDYTTESRSELLKIIHEAGIAGMGGAGFPAGVKLSVRHDQPIATLIINGTECEPYITADDILMRERAEQVIHGAQIIRHILNDIGEVLIGVEDNKPEAAAALGKAAEGSGIEVVTFPTTYPSGGEKQLIRILTGKEVPVGGLPADIGVVCQNVGTTVAIYKAVVLGEPVISRITTVTGNAVATPRNYEVRLGTPVGQLLAASGFVAEKATRKIVGGPMMGFSFESLEIPITKTVNCLLLPDRKEMPAPTPARACIRCGMCAEACPVSLLPQQLYWFARSHNREALKEHHLFDCIECGACSYACPSAIPLVQYYRAAKAEIRRAESDHKKAEYSKMRFESRSERLARIEAEKEAKRKERQEKAALARSTSDGVDPVEAALARVKAKQESAVGEQTEP